jgi:hypothetical protein
MSDCEAANTVYVARKAAGDDGAQPIADDKVESDA